jgi:hypothetical protein
MGIRSGVNQTVSKCFSKFNEVNSDLLNVTVATYDWENIVSGNNINTVTELFTSSVLSIFERHINHYDKIMRSNDKP